MLEPVSAASGGDVSVWVALAGVVLGALSAAFAPLISIISDRFTRADDVKKYKRIVYRNFLDHGYWYRALPEGDEKRDRHKKYTADWFRIRLISDDKAVREAVIPLREPEKLTEDKERELFEVFSREIKRGGLGD